MRENVIWYRGAGYQLGHGPHGYAIWAAGRSPHQPLEQWPETPAGWSAAWSRFNAVEAPGSIVHLGPPAGPASGPPAGFAWPPARSAGALTAAIVLAAGVACGVAGLFPSYLSGASLAREPAELVPHVIYLAVWAASGLLVVSGGIRRRMGALLALGLSIVTFGLFFADLGTVISGGAHVLGAGLVLGLVGWLACTAGSVLAFRLRSPDAPRKLDGRRRGPAVTGPVIMLTVATFAAIGAAVSFAPSWDSYTLRTAAGVTRTLTAGNAFANPAPVIAGDVAVMVALVTVVVLAALWRPVRLGAVLLAGAAIPMAAQAISALVLTSEHVSASNFGISPAQAAQAGITVSAGVTLVFWIYCAFVVALLMAGAWMFMPQRPVNRAANYPGAIPAPLPATMGAGSWAGAGFWAATGSPAGTRPAAATGSAVGTDSPASQAASAGTAVSPGPAEGPAAP